MWGAAVVGCDICSKRRGGKKYDLLLEWLSLGTFLIPNWSGYRQQLHCQSLLEGSSLQCTLSRERRQPGWHCSVLVDTAARLSPLAYDGIVGQSLFRHSALKPLDSVLRYHMALSRRGLLRQRLLGSSQEKPASATPGPTDVIAGVPTAMAVVTAVHSGVIAYGGRRTLT